jgi:putative membrane protein
MYWDHMNGWGWTMMIFWALIWIGFLGLIAWLAVQWTRTNSQGSAPSQPSSKTARELLDERLARGEIDAAEYQRLRDLIGADDGRAPADTGSVR